MILMISSQGKELRSSIDERFGRCQWLLKYDTETKQCEAFQNPGLQQSGGAGVAAAQFVIDQAVDVVISGDFGPHAANALRAGNIKMHLFDQNLGKVDDVIDSFLMGSLSSF
ncbi:MAG TPA: NifB/NifX family molybdenum-iron cluster-binding protein [Anaerolineaceae bacterium]|nr:NifB/NifX family molybdenum-iron cluster-binding protein [Anaerolineaceae bacterium]